jgi:hypothetical protein
MMKAKIARWCTALLLLGSLTIQADPFHEWSWTAPTQYENGSAIPSTDNLMYTLKCGITQGGPYDRFEAVLQKPPPDTLDMGLLVQGQPGSYFCIATATSTLYSAESDPSNEVNFTVLPSDLGLRPKPPVLNLNR